MFFPGTSQHILAAPTSSDGHSAPELAQGALVPAQLHRAARARGLADLQRQLRDRRGQGLGLHQATQAPETLHYS